MNFAELVLIELKAFAKRKKVANDLHMNYALALTRRANSKESTSNIKNCKIPRENLAVEEIQRERMQELEERRVLAQKQQQDIILELNKRKQQEESTPDPVLQKQQRVKSQLEQGQASGQEYLTRPAQEKERQRIPTREQQPPLIHVPDTQDEQSGGIEVHKTHLNGGGP